MTNDLLIAHMMASCELSQSRNESTEKNESIAKINILNYLFKSFENENFSHLDNIHEYFYKYLAEKFHINPVDLEDGYLSTSNEEQKKHIVRVSILANAIIFRIKMLWNENKDCATCNLYEMTFDYIDFNINNMFSNDHIERRYAHCKCLLSICDNPRNHHYESEELFKMLASVVRYVAKL